MRAVLKNLGRNLVAGLRLALFMPVSRLAFRIDLAQLLLLFLLSAAIDVGGDWLRYGPDAFFSWYGLGSELFAVGLMVVTLALIAFICCEPTLVPAALLLSFAGYPYLQIVHALPFVAEDSWLALHLDSTFDWLMTLWVVALFARALALALAPATAHRWVKAVAGGLLLAAPIWVAPLIAPTEPWWQQPAMNDGIDPRYPSPVSEPVLAAQQDLLDDALNDLDDERSGVTDLYFVGFGGSASEDVFRKDVQAARKVMDDNWDTDGHSIAMINNPRTLLDTPIATVTNLRAALNEIGGAINAEEDVVMLYLASHGSKNHTLQISLPPLDLAQLTPSSLRSMLDDSGIKWRIIVVSACYSGAYIDALQDERTLVMTASQADRPSFGCSPSSDATYFGEALFQQGLTKADNILAAFDLAKKRIAEREKAKGYLPSNPQIFVGAKMAEKIAELDRRGAGRHSGHNI